MAAKYIKTGCNIESGLALNHSFKTKKLVRSEEVEHSLQWLVGYTNEQCRFPLAVMLTELHLQRSGVP